MQVAIVNVDIEVGKPGPKGWSKAVVDYEVNGQRRKQNIMSFTNPAVYKAVTSGQFTGETVEVDIIKNAKGYDEWTAIQAAGTGNGASGASAPAPTGTTTSAATRVTGSNYETAVERARRQVLIVRQSSLSNAIDILKSTEALIEIEEVLPLAQRLVDWVFDEGTDEGAE